MATITREDGSYIDQPIASIRQNGEWTGYIDIIGEKITTSGTIGENIYTDMIECFKGLQGYEITLDDIYWTV